MKPQIPTADEEFHSLFTKMRSRLRSGSPDPVAQAIDWAWKNSDKVALIYDKRGLIIDMAEIPF